MLRSGVSTLKRWLLRTVLWLPLSFTVWYFTAKPLASITGALAHYLVRKLTPGILSRNEIPSAMQSKGFDVDFLTNIDIHPAPGVTGDLMLDVNSLFYTYGLALFLALMLSVRAKWWKITLGVVLLLPFQSWGIAFDFLGQAFIRISPTIDAQISMPGWHRELIGIGYQLGHLIFPCLIPVILWLAFNRQFIEQLLQPEPYLAACRT